MVPTPVLVAAAASGLAVVAVTVVAERVGGRLGGLLSTAPVTTTAAFLHLAGSGDLVPKVATGGLSLLAAIAAMPLFVLTVAWTGRWPARARVAAALFAYVAGFTAGTALLQRVTPPAWAGWGYAAAVAVVAMLRLVLPADAPAAIPKTRLTWLEGLARFAAGAAVILLVHAAGATDPVLGAAWAVFPGTFLVSIGVMGFAHGPAFGARAVRAAVQGGVPLAAFLLVYMGLLMLSSTPWWPVLAMVPAWGAYFGTLLVLEARAPPAAQSVPGRSTL